MQEGGKISPGQFQIVVTIFTIGNAILVTPAPFAATAKQDAWIGAFLTILTSLLFVFVFNKIASLYPSMTYVEYSEKILGKWIGKMAALPYLIYISVITCGQVRNIGDFFTTEILVETPIQMIMIAFIVTSLIGVRLGIEVICRSAITFFPWIVALLLLLFFFMIPQVKLENFQPILATGLKPIIKASYHSWGNPLELGIFLMIIPYVTNKTELKKSFYMGYLLGGIVITIIITFCISVLGDSLTARQTYPTYILAKKISIGKFIERVEAIVGIIWIFTLYFKFTICYYALSLGLAQIFELKNYKILTFPLAFLIISFSIFIFQNIVEYQQFTKGTLTLYSFTICFIFPLLIFIIGKIRFKYSPSIASKLK